MQEVNKNMDEKIEGARRLLEKIWANSFYPPYIPNVFYWPLKNPDEIAKTAREVTKELFEKFKDL